MYSLVTQIGTFSFGREIEIDVHWCNILSLKELFLVLPKLGSASKAIKGHVEALRLGVDVGDDVEDRKWTLGIKAPAISLILTNLGGFFVIIQFGMIISLGTAKGITLKLKQHFSTVN